MDTLDSATDDYKVETSGRITINFAGEGGPGDNRPVTPFCPA